MLIVADIRRRIEHLIEADPVIKKGLQRRIINSRALARYILEADRVNSTPDAVLGVIRRYPIGSEKQDDHRKVFRDCEIATRTKMADLALENGPEIMKKIAEFASSIKTTRGENLRVIVGLRSIRVIADMKTLETFRRTLRPKDILSYSTDLAEISLLFPQEAKDIPGIMAKITAQLALNDVNLAGIQCCSPEDIIMVAEADASRALEAIQQLLKEEARIHIDPEKTN